jgi:hypothetical protein
MRHHLIASSLFLSACSQVAGPTAVVITPDTPATVDELQAVVNEGDCPDGCRWLWACDGVEQGHLDSSSVPASRSSKGERWQVWVRNAGADPDAAVSAEVTIANSPPTASLSLEPAQPDASQEILAHVELEDADLDAVTASYSWSVDGVASELQGASVPAEATSGGQTWTLVVVPSDDECEGEAVSTSVTVVSQGPVVSSVILEPQEAYEDSVLEALVEASSPDGGSPDLSYSWWVDGVEVLSGVQAQLDGASFDKHQEVVVEVTPSAGGEQGETVASEPVLILNSPPGAPWPELDPAFPEIGVDPLHCALLAEADDADGDALDHSFTWTVDGVAFEAGGSTVYPGDTVAAESLAQGSLWTCTVVASDGEASGEPASVSLDLEAWDPSLNLLTIADVELLAEAAQDQAGNSVASGGDIDGDGLDDLLVGATGADGVASDSGTVYLLLGSGLLAGGSRGLASAEHRWSGSGNGAHIPGNLAFVGDVDGDGLDDFALGSTSDSTGGASAGAVWLVRGADLGATGSHDTSDDIATCLTGDSPGARLGGLAGAGDLDSDGLDDLLLSGEGSDFAGIVYLRSGSGITSGEHAVDDGELVLTGASTRDSAGAAMTTVGDLDGDGLMDLLVGAPQTYLYSGSCPGKMHVVLGSTAVAGGWVSLLDAEHSLIGEDDYDEAGGRILGWSDQDGDGLDDFLVGAHNNDYNGTSAGKIYGVLAASLGTVTTDLASADYQLLGEGPGAYAGLYMGVGEVDGDGRPDLFAGAVTLDSTDTHSGRSYLYLGSSFTGPGSYQLDWADYQLDGLAEDDRAGRVTLGDLDGNGLDDLVVGADCARDIGYAAGKVYALYSVF